MMWETRILIAALVLLAGGAGIFFLAVGIAIFMKAVGL